MTVEMSAPAVGLTAYAAAEIRAYLGRLSISKAELARRISENETWVGKRLNGRIDLTLTDLERIAKAIGVSPTQLLPGRGGATTTPTTGLAGDLGEIKVQRRIPLAPRVVTIGGQLPGQKSTPARAVRLRPHSSHDHHRRPVTQVAR